MWSASSSVQSGYQPLKPILTVQSTKNRLRRDARVCRKCIADDRGNLHSGRRCRHARTEGRVRAAAGLPEPPGTHRPSGPPDGNAICGRIAIASLQYATIARVGSRKLGRQGSGGLALKSKLRLRAMAIGSRMRGHSWRQRERAGCTATRRRGCTRCSVILPRRVGSDCCAQTHQCCSDVRVAEKAVHEFRKLHRR